MEFLGLTLYSYGDKVFINMDKVCQITTRMKEDKEVGSTLFFSDQDEFGIKVTETPFEILEMLECEDNT